MAPHTATSQLSLISGMEPTTREPSTPPPAIRPKREAGKHQSIPKTETDVDQPAADVFSLVRDKLTAAVMREVDKVLNSAVKKAADTVRATPGIVTQGKKNHANDVGIQMFVRLLESRRLKAAEKGRAEAFGESQDGNECTTDFKLAENKANVVLAKLESELTAACFRKVAKSIDSFESRFTDSTRATARALTSGVRTGFKAHEVTVAMPRKLLEPSFRAGVERGFKEWLEKFEGDYLRLRSIASVDKTVLINKDHNDNETNKADDEGEELEEKKSEEIVAADVNEIIVLEDEKGITERKGLFRNREVPFASPVAETWDEERKEAAVKLREVRRVSYHRRT